MKTLKYVLFALIGRVILTPLRLLPVKPKRVLFVSFRGKQYSCNPRYISEALEGSGLELIWAFHEPEKFKYLEEKGIRVISDRTLQFVLTAMTSRVIVTNTYFKPYLPRRRQTKYLRTWHGGGSYKRVTYPRGLKGFYIGLQQQGADLYLSSSKKFTRETIREAFGYKGEVLEAGMPRNDALVTGAWKEIGEKTKQELEISEHIALYAPTYREDSVKNGYGLDVTALREALTARFGGEWKILFRGHHVVANQDEMTGFDGDESGYPDMMPLLAAADVLITDYSSSMWDMSLMKKPVFLYCTDIKSYVSERDFFTPISEWPFPISENNEELNKNIRLFDEKAYAENVSAHHEALGNCETGTAAAKTAEWVKKMCEK